MKTFPTKLSGVELPAAVADFNTLVINIRDRYVFLEFPVWASAEAKAAGEEPLPNPIKLTLSGDRVQKLAQEFPELFAQLVVAAFTIADAEGAFPADAKNV